MGGSGGNAGIGGADADGSVAEDFGGSDCDDADAGISDAALEICGDGVDNDCDGEVDEGVGTTYYEDSDGDGFGNVDESIEACEQPDGYVPIGNDCDDTSEDAYPGAAEECDGLDNDCDGANADECWLDTDMDGHGVGTPTQDNGDGTCSAGDMESILDNDRDDLAPGSHPPSPQTPRPAITFWYYFDKGPVINVGG